MADVKSVCADETLAQDTGVVCGGPGVQVTGTGAYVYTCCEGNLCNKDAATAAMLLQVQPSPPRIPIPQPSTLRPLARPCSRGCNAVAHIRTPWQHG